jgi:hypothetical protein
MRACRDMAENIAAGLSIPMFMRHRGTNMASNQGLNSGRELQSTLDR